MSREQQKKLNRSKIWKNKQILCKTEDTIIVTHDWFGIKNKQFAKGPAPLDVIYKILKCYAAKNVLHIQFHFTTISDN